MDSCESIKVVKLEDIDVHPSILEVMPIEHLDCLMVDMMTIEAYRSEACMPMFVVKKKDRRKKFWVYRGVGTYYAHLRLYEKGELSSPTVIINPNNISNDEVQEKFLYESTVFSRNHIASGALGLMFKKVLENRESKQLSLLVSPSLNDIASSRSDTLRKLTGYDGRAFNNACKNVNQPESLINAVKGWK